MSFLSFVHVVIGNRLLRIGLESNIKSTTAPFDTKIKLWVTSFEFLPEVSFRCCCFMVGLHLNLHLCSRIDFGSSGPVTISLSVILFYRKGFYIAIQDQGACMAVISLRAYYHYCPEVSKNLVTYPRTVSDAAISSLVTVNGRCTTNAVLIDRASKLTLSIV